MKKGVLGIIILAIIGTIYYFSQGSSQLTKELQKTIDQELATLQKEGFSIEERKVEDGTEHFIIVLDDTKKIIDFFNKDRQQVTQDEIASLAGMKIGVDIQYLKDTYSALSFDLYPVALPTSLTTGELSQEDRDTLTKIDALFTDKIFLVHIDINKMLNGFKGYVKDIDKTFEENGQQASLTMHSFVFSGDIKEEQITSIQQQLGAFSLHVDNELDMKVNNVKSTYLLHGATLYDTTVTYSVGQIIFDEAKQIAMTLDKLDIRAKTDFSNGLAKSNIFTSIDSLNIKDDKREQIIKTLKMESTLSNLDLPSFEKLKNIDTLDQEEINTIVQKILSSGLSFEISSFSIDNITSAQQALGGFDLSAKIDIDQSINLSLLQTNPLAGLSSIDANLRLALSDTLFGFVSQQPDALLAMMMFQPKEENNKKIYIIELKNGILNVNGIPMM